VTAVVMGKCFDGGEVSLPKYAFVTLSSFRCLRLLIALKMEESAHVA